MSQDIKPKRRKTAKQIQQEKTNFLTSITRTIVPIVVGSVSGSFLGQFIDQDALTTVVTGVISAAYYIAVRFLERNYPAAGILLGSKRQPTYKKVEKEK